MMSKAPADIPLHLVRVFDEGLRIGKTTDHDSGYRFEIEDAQEKIEIAKSLGDDKMRAHHEAKLLTAQEKQRVWQLGFNEGSKLRKKLKGGLDV